MAENSQITQIATGKSMVRFDWLRLSDALAIAWVGLVFLVMAVPPLVSETVALGESWWSYSPALETSLRWQFGHLPHVDYHTATGIAYWLNQGIAVEVVGLGAKTGLVANLLAAALVALVGLFLVRPRMTALMTALLLTGALAMIVETRQSQRLVVGALRLEESLPFTLVQLEGGQEQLLGAFDRGRHPTSL